MPWDHSHPRVFEMQKSAHKLSPAAFRSGCYQRAITLLHSEDGDYTGRDATAASLCRLLANANRKVAVQANNQASNNRQPESSSSQHQNQSDKENHGRDMAHLRSIKQQLRRQRQEQRHEQHKQLWQRRHEDKVRLRQQGLAARSRQQDEERNKQMQKLQHQQQSLEQRLEQHRQQSTELTGVESTPADAERAIVLQQQLVEVQQMRAKAEEQLAMVNPHLKL